MVVFSNRRLGASAELLVSDDVASSMLHATATAARSRASARWEQELAQWLDARAKHGAHVLDVTDIAWTPDHFEGQRRFLVDAIHTASTTLPHALAFDRWRRLIEAHPADSVQVGRRWQWQPSA